MCQAIRDGGAIAGAVIDADPVGIAAIVKQTLAERSLHIDGCAGANSQEGLVRNSPGAQIDGATAKFAGQVRRVGLLDQHALQGRGREKVQRNHPAQGRGARQWRAVQQRRGIALVQATDVDEFVLGGRDTGHAGKRRSSVAIALKVKIAFVDKGRHFRRIALFIGNELAADNDSLLTGFGLFDGGCGLLFYRGCRIGGGRVLGQRG